MKNITDLILERSKGNIDNYSSDEQKLASMLKPYVGKELKINLQIGETQISQAFIKQAIDRSLGHIVESYICSELKTKSAYKEGKEIYDATIKIGNTDFNLEIKAFKNGKTSNITFTQNQIKNLHDENITFIFINYTLSNESFETTLTIKDILFGKYDDVISSNGTLSRHGNVSRMISLK